MSAGQEVGDIARRQAHLPVDDLHTAPSSDLSAQRQPTSSAGTATAVGAPPEAPSPVQQIFLEALSASGARVWVRNLAARRSIAASSTSV